MTYLIAVTADLLDFDLTLVAALPNAYDIRFMDEKSGPGSGTITLPLSDPLAGDLISGRHIAIKLNGTTRFVFKIEGNPEYREIGEAEEISQVVVASGRGLACALDEAIIYPEFDLNLPLDSSWRLFSFASPSFPNGGSWPGSTELYEYRDFDEAATRGRVQAVTDADDVTTLYVAPIGFPWPNSPKNGNGILPTVTYIPTYWIWPSAAAEGDEGYAFFFQDFTLDTDQPVTFSVTADNLFTFFLEGVPIIGEDADHWMWQGYKEVTIWLPGGTYRVGCVVENVVTTLAFNPGGFLYAAYVSAADGEIESVPWVSAQETEGTWKSHFSASAWPGWTPAQIVSQLKSEAEARGALASFPISEGFANFEDSNGDDWDSLDTETSSEFVPSFAIEVGKTILDALDQLHNEGWIDWHMQPDGTLDMWAGSSTVTPLTVEYQADVDVVSLVRGQTSPYANALLVQWAKGFVEVDDASAIAAYGSRVEDLYSTDAETAADAERLGRIELQRRALSARAAVVMTIEPLDSAHAPYVGVNLRDEVEVPDEAGTGTDVLPILSFACVQDSEGYAIFTLELGRRYQNPEREQASLLRSIGGKTLGSVRDHGVVD